MEDFFEYKVWFSTVNISNKKKFILLDNMENEKHIYENRKFLSRKNKYLKNLDVDMQNEEVENIIENIDKNKYKFTTFSHLMDEKLLRILLLNLGKEILT